MAAKTPASVVPQPSRPPGIEDDELPAPDSVNSIHWQAASTFSQMVHQNEGIEKDSELAVSTWTIEGDNKWTGKRFLIATAVLDGLEDIHIRTLLSFVEQALRDEAGNDV